MEWSWKVRMTLLTAVLAMSVTSASTERVSEAEAIRLFLEQSPQAKQGSLIVRSVDAQFRVEARVAGPEVAYQVEDAAGVRDEFLTAQQALPITGLRALLGERASLASASAGRLAQADLQADAYDLKQTFHEVLYRESVRERFQRGAVLLERTVEILAARELEGAGSGYDVLRAEQELAELRMTAAEGQAALAAARSRFGSFFDPTLRMDSAHLVGDPAVSGPTPEINRAVDLALAQRLDLRSLSSEQERLDLERRAARRRRFPEPILTAGWKRTAAVGLSESGYVAGLSVALPIFGRARIEASRAGAEGERVELEKEMLARRIRAEVQAAVAREQVARRNVQVYGENIERRAVELHRVARLKYDEGESGILELLDAHRTSLTMQLRALAAWYEARMAEIDRNRVIGNEVKP